jgi:peptidoglycan/xylan/chitin deacetylase (PgdA/CDA1 family)
MPLAATIAVAAGAVGVGVAAATLTYAIVGDEAQIFGRTLVSPTLPNQIALTFDDGPNPTATPRLLEILARHNARATFFLIGQFVRQQPALTREIAAAGHVIGNHTMNHPWLPRLSRSRILAELTDCNRALEDTLGRKVDFFRPPHGAKRPAVFRAASALGLSIVQWNLIVRDWNPVPAETILTRIEAGIARNQSRSRGTNVVLHDGGQSRLGEPRIPTVEAVSQLLARLAAGTEFVVPRRDPTGEFIFASGS